MIYAIWFVGGLFCGTTLTLIGVRVGFKLFVAAHNAIGDEEIKLNFSGGSEPAEFELIKDQEREDLLRGKVP